MKPNIALLINLLKSHGFTLNTHQLNQLWRYHNLLYTRNQDRDLTRIIAFDQMVLKHYVDCLIVSKYVKLISPIVDIGTGAGFPGIVLKIQNPELELTLAEPRPNRIQFLNDVIRELQLKKISVFGHKVTSNSFSTPVSMVITRALETIDKTILRSSGAVSAGTQIVFMKGPNVDQELKEALKLFGNYYHLKEDIAYNLPKSNQQRRLVILKCVKKPDNSFSRYKN